MDKKTNGIFKKSMPVLFSITAAALIVCAAALGLKRDASVAAQAGLKESYTSYYSPKPSPSQEMPESAAALPSSRPSSGEKAEEYLITVYNGKIGVFRGGETAPFLIADTDVYLLPERDVSILRQGIRVDSFPAVKSVLEDYE